MQKENFVYNKTYNKYGKVVLTLDKMLEKRNMKPYRLSILTGINWGIIKKYVRGDLYRVDLDLLAKICFALNCSLNEIIHYEDERTVQRKNQENDMKNTRKILDKV